MTDSSILLSAIVVVGAHRERAQRSVTALNQQSVANAMEVIVVDLNEGDYPEMKMTGPAKHKYVHVSKKSSFGEAKYAGFLRATSPIVAFIEDHCFASPRWAEELIEVYKSNWASVGYGFQNANPQTYLSRVSMFLDYGLWQVPMKSIQATTLPGNNISYRREVILQYGAELKEFLEIDFNLHRSLLSKNMGLYVAADAVVSHQNFAYLAGTLHANFAYARVLASIRVKVNRWNIFKRFFYMCGTPFVAPPIRLYRLINSFRYRENKRKQFFKLLKALPILLVAFTWTAFGEAAGYIAGAGNSRERLAYWETGAERNKIAA